MLKLNQVYTTSKPLISPTPSQQVIAKGDSVASNHYWKQADCGVLQNIAHEPGPSVHQPDNTSLPSVGTGQLPISQALSPAGRHAMIIPALKSANLISLGQLCDDNCNIVLTKSHLHTIKNGKIILQGYRNPRDGLWDIPLTKHSANNQVQPTESSALQDIPLNKHSNITTDQVPLNGLPTTVPKQHSMNVIIRKQQPAKDLVQYLHAACFSPVKSTWLKAIQNNQFITWPGLTTELVNKHLPKSIATAQGHLHRERQNLQSTKLISDP